MSQRKNLVKKVNVTDKRVSPSKQLDKNRKNIGIFQHNAGVEKIDEKAETLSFWLKLIIMLAVTGIGLSYLGKWAKDSNKEKKNDKDLDIDERIKDVCSGKTDEIYAGNKPDDVSYAIVNSAIQLESCFKEEKDKCASDHQKYEIFSHIGLERNNLLTETVRKPRSKQYAEWLKTQEIKEQKIRLTLKDEQKIIFDLISTKTKQLKFHDITATLAIKNKIGNCGEKLAVAALRTLKIKQDNCVQPTFTEVTGELASIQNNHAFSLDIDLPTDVHSDFKVEGKAESNKFLQKNSGKFLCDPWNKKAEPFNPDLYDSFNEILIQISTTSFSRFYELPYHAKKHFRDTMASFESVKGLDIYQATECYKSTMKKNK